MKLIISLKGGSTTQVSESASRLESSISRLVRTQARIDTAKAKPGYRTNDAAKESVKTHTELLKTLKVRIKKLSKDEVKSKPSTKTIVTMKRKVAKVKAAPAVTKVKVRPAAPIKAATSPADTAKIEKHKSARVKFEAKPKA